MAGKIIIRRVGSLVPTLCLLGITASVLLITLLGTCGFPDWVVRRVEEAAARRGIYLRIQSMKLDPMQGIAVRAEGVSVYADAGCTGQPLATMQGVETGVSLRSLAAGHLRPGRLLAEGITISLPVTHSAGERPEIRDGRICGSIAGNGTFRLTEGKLSLQGIPISLSGSISAATLEEISQSGFGTHGKRLDPADLQAKYADSINAVYSTIRSQNWAPKEFPSLVVQFDLNGARVRGSLRIQVPRFDSGVFHFRDATANLTYSDGMFTINSLNFHTEAPAASASLKGAYDMKKSRLGFQLHSNVALFAMGKKFGNEALRNYLRKFNHPEDSSPVINAEGEIGFGQDYTLRSARVRGNILQKKLSIVSSTVDEARISFFYDNGNFNIDNLELRLPDGRMQGQATVKEGYGQAQLAADLPVQRVLTLLRELTDRDVDLPEELQPGERVNMQVHADLNAPVFKPGGVNWQDFVPGYREVGVLFSSDFLRYGPVILHHPKISMSLKGIRHDENLVPRHIHRAETRIQSQEAEFVGNETTAPPPLRLSGAQVHLQLEDIASDAAGVPQTISRALGQISADKLDVSQVSRNEQEGDEQFRSTIRSLSADVDFAGVSMWAAHDSPLRMSAARAKALVNARDAAVYDWSAHDVTLRLDDVQDIYLQGDMPDRIFSGADIRAEAADVSRAGKELGTASLQSTLRAYSTGSAQLVLSLAEQGEKALLSADTDWGDPEQIHLRNLQLHVPHEVLERMQTLYGDRMTEFRLPHDISADGFAQLDTKLNLQLLRLRVRSNGLIRTPHKQRAFAGQQIPLDIAAQIDARRDAAEHHLLYRILLEATHTTGAFRGTIDGSTAGHLRIGGSATMRPDVVDALIDNRRAHNIIRDFHFTDKSSTRVTDISADVDYSAGIRVDSYCNVDLADVGYQFSVTEQTEDGHERLRTDLGKDPYVAVNRVTCGVATHVRMDCTAPDGTREPEESVITVVRPTVVYNNTPWLRKKTIRGGPTESTLFGDTVVIDIEHSFVDVRNVRGVIYPTYSLGMYYPRLYDLLEDVQLNSPAQMEAPGCVFPIYDDCVRPMSGTIYAKVAEGGAYNFSGTMIPMENFSGFIRLTDDYVLLDRLNAHCWDGVVDGTVKLITKNRRTGFDGYVRMQCLNLKKIAAAYGSKQAPALCSGEIRFRSPDTVLKNLRAYGKVDIADGNLISLSIFRPLSEFLSDLPTHFSRLEEDTGSAADRTRRHGLVMRGFSALFNSMGNIIGTTGKAAGNIPMLNHIIAYTLREAHATFTITNGILRTTDLIASGSNLDVRLNVGINLGTLQLNGNLWPRVTSLPTVLLAPLSVLSDFMVDIVLYGSVRDIKWRVAPDKRIKNRRGAPSPTSGRRRTPSRSGSDARSPRGAQTPRTPKGNRRRKKG